MNIFFMFPLKNLARKGLKWSYEWQIWCAPTINNDKAIALAIERVGGANFYSTQNDGKYSVDQKIDFPLK